MLKLFRTNIAYAIGTTAQSAALFLLIPYLINAFSTEEYGAWSLFEISIFFLSMLILSGMDVGLMREYWFLESEEKRRQLSGTVLAAILGWGSFVTAFACLMFWFFERQIASSGFLPVKFVLTSLILVATSAFAEAVLALLLSILRIREEVNRFVALSLGRMLLFLAAAIGGVQLGYGLNGALGGRLIGAVVGVIVAIAFTNRYLALAFESSSLRRVIRYGLPLLPTNMASYVLFAADRYILNLFSTLEVVGIYSLTYKVTTTLDILVTRPFSLDWAPRRFKIATEPEPERKYVNALLVYLFIAISMSLLILAGIPAIYEWFVPEIYKQGMGLIPILLLAYLAYGLSYPLNVGIMLKDRTQYLPYLSWLSALLCLGLNFWWIPRFGMAGAAWATLLSYSFWTASITVVSLKLYPIHYPVRSLLALVLAALAGYGGILAAEQLLPTQMVLLALSLKVLWVFLVMTGLGYFLWRDTFKSLKLKLKSPSPSIVTESDQ